MHLLQAHTSQGRHAPTTGSLHKEQHDWDACLGGVGCARALLCGCPKSGVGGRDSPHCAPSGAQTAGPCDFMSAIKSIVMLEVACAWDLLIGERGKRMLYRELEADLAKQWPGHKIVLLPMVCVGP